MPGMKLVELGSGVGPSLKIPGQEWDHGFQIREVAPFGVASLLMFLS